MIKKLEQRDYKKILPLLESSNELSVFSVIHGSMPGSIYVNKVETPTAAFIQTSECNLVAGTINDSDFNKGIAEKLDFWDTITPDSKQWNDVISQIHPDKYIRKYIRRHYILDIKNWESKNFVLPDGYYLEQVNPEMVRQSQYENADQIIEWLDNWGDDKNISQYGAGAYVRNETTIVSWSLSDCAQGENIAIGIHTDEDYRRKGFAEITVNEMIRLCFLKGYQHIEWLCVDCNKGSIAVAEKSGFKLQNKYESFAPYAPVENLLDLSEPEWNEWAEYFENSAKSEPRLIMEAIYTYIKANNPAKANEMLMNYKINKSPEHIKQCEENIKQFIGYLQSMGMASRFMENWMG